MLRASKFQQAPGDKSLMRMQIGVALSILSGDGFEFIEPRANYSGGFTYVATVALKVQTTRKIGVKKPLNQGWWQRCR